MDYDQIAARVLRALRGERSQIAFSRRLGYSSNVAHTWETGKRMPTAATVWRAARRVGADPDAGLQRFFLVTPPSLLDLDPATPEGMAALLRELRRDLPVAQVAERIGRSRFQVARWMAGRAEPRLPDLLRLIDGCTGRLLDFIAVWVDPRAVEGLSAPWERLEAARTLFWRHPRAQLVLLALDLEAYRVLPAHDDRWLADRLGLELYQVVDDLERLSRTGQIAWDGARWAVGDVHTVDTRRYPEAGRALKRWWADVARDRVDAADASTSYNVFSISEEDRQQVVELYRSAFASLRAIVAASSPGERLVLVMSHVVALDAPSTDSHQGSQDRPMTSAVLP